MKVLSGSEARALRAWAARRPAAAASALRRARAIREVVAEVLQAVSHGRRPPARALAALESACLAAARARRLRPLAGHARWEWRRGAAEPLRPALAAALNAERLLTSSPPGRVSQCGDAQCGWFFLDVSRNRSRRWCSMKVCGNRNKARRHYRRAKAETSR